MGKSKSGKVVRLPFIFAGVVALAGFGVVCGIAFDLAMRPAAPIVSATAPSHAPPLPSRNAPSPKLVIPGRDDTNPLMMRGEGRRAWAPSEETPPVKEAPPDAGAPVVAFAVPVAASTRPVIAIVIDDMGVDRTNALKMIALPGPLTLSLMTYAERLPDLVQRAHGAGHELMAHLPMEPVSPKENPGPGALLVKMDEPAIRHQMAKDLDGWTGYVGVNNHMGSKFTADATRMSVVMEEIKSRGLMWLDSRTTGDSTSPAAAKRAGVPFVARDIFLDNVETVDAVLKQLAELKATAKAHGTGIAIGHPHNATIAALKQWLPEMKANGLTLVPITEILRRRNAERKEAPSP